MLPSDPCREHVEFSLNGIMSAPVPSLILGEMFAWESSVVYISPCMTQRAPHEAILELGVRCQPSQTAQTSVYVPGAVACQLRANAISPLPAVGILAQETRHSVQLSGEIRLDFSEQW
jgi:hypothetical protein